jgi:signal transduction histidine kinase
MILLVDDKEENLFSLKSLLQLHKYEVDTALSGEEALRKILKNDYALIILDVQMPVMDGYEVAETVSGYSKTKNIPIIFLSAINIDKRYVHKGYASGGVDYVTKPFDPDLLLLKVQTFTRLYEQNRQLTLVQSALKEEISIRKEAERALQQANLALEDKVKERTSALLQMNQELEQSNLELQQYASVASHDLQEPLRKIITFSRLVQDKFVSDSEEGGKYIKKVITSSERMRNLINDLLNYSKLSASHHFVPTDLYEVVTTTLNDLEISIAEKNAQFTIDHLPVIEAVPGLIRQMFQNILSNALKFSKKEVQPQISISARYVAEKKTCAPEDKNGKYLRICIDDNGIGFDESYRDKIFTLFQRLHPKEQFEGTGIGLAIVKKIIEKHNGVLNVKSKEGEGTTFIIVLPASQHSLSEPHQPA